jgi:hypothetical protein
LENVVDIKCPANCTCSMEEGDIKCILEKASFDKYLFKKERLKILSIKNRFHCLSPNCSGFFVKKDSSNKQDSLLKCHVCNETNCLSCLILVDKSELNKHECIFSSENKIIEPLQVYYGKLFVKF